jgi:hypothetical protein
MISASFVVSPLCPICQRITFGFDSPLLGPLTKDSDFLVREHIHLEIALGPSESVARLHELFCYPRVKRRLVKLFIRDNVA